MKITVTGLCQAFNISKQNVESLTINQILITDAKTLKNISGLEYNEDVISNYLDSPLDDIGLHGGGLRIKYNEALKILQVITEYLSPRKLKESELKKLLNQTLGQWSDGLGEGCFNGYLEKTGIHIDVYPSNCKKSDFAIEQIECEITVPKPKRIPQIVGAAKKGDVVKLASLLNKGADIDDTDKHGATALVQAIYGKHTEAALFLINQGANISPNKYDCLAIAANFRNLSVFKALVDKGANVNKLSSYSTPIQWVALWGNLEAMKLLIEHGVDVNEQRDTDRVFGGGYGFNDLTPLMWVNDIEVAELLLTHGANPNAQSKYNGYSVLAYQLWQRSSRAIHSKSPLTTDDFEFFKLLLKYGADVNVRSVRNGHNVYEEAFSEAVRLEEDSIRVLAEFLKHHA
jgi:ankyrin repeat protein